MLLIHWSQWLVHIWHSTRSFNVSSLVFVNRINSLTSEHAKTWILTHCSFAFGACNARTNWLIWQRNEGKKIWGVWCNGLHCPYKKTHSSICLVHDGWVGLGWAWNYKVAKPSFFAFKKTIQCQIDFGSIPHFCIITCWYVIYTIYKEKN